MNLFKLSWRNLRSKPLSMSLSILLFALGVGLVSLLMLFDKQLKENFEKNLAGINMVIGAKGSPLQLILCSMYHIDNPTGNISLGEARPFLNPKHPIIDKAIPLSMGDSYQTFRITGTTPDFMDLYEVNLQQGKLWNSHFEVSIGASVAAKTGLKVGDEFQSSHGFVDDPNLSHEDAHSFKVVGIFEPSGTVVDQLILTTTQSLWMVHNHDEEGHDDHQDEATETAEEHDHAHHDHDHHDHAHEGENQGSIAKLLEESDEMEITTILVKFRGNNFQALNMPRAINSNTDMQAATPAIEINRLYSLMDTGQQALQYLAYIIILVTIFSIFVSLYSSLKDRKYELALMRSMGGTPTTLFMLIIIEGLLIAIIGFAIGIILSHVGMNILAQAMEESYRYTFSGWRFITEEIFLLGGSLLIGILAAVIPAIQAAKTDIADTLTT